MELWEQAYQVLLNSPSDLVLLLDLGGRIDFVNATFLQLSGLRLDSVIGRGLDEILPPALAAKRMEVVAEVARTGQSTRFEDQGVSAWFDNSVYPIFSATGQVEKIAVIARDITHRKKIEHELKLSHQTLIETEHALRQRENQLRAVINYAPIILIVIEADGTIRMAEGRDLAAANYPPEVLIGQNVLRIVSEFPVAEKMVERALSGEAFSQIYTFAGNLIYDVTFSPQLGDSGRLETVFVTAVEFTQKASMLKKLELNRDELTREVEARTAELAQANRELRAEIALRSQAEKELRRQAGHAQALVRAAAHASAAHGLVQIAEAICNVAIETVSDYPLAALGLFEIDSERMQLLATAGNFEDTLAKTTRLSRRAYEILLERHGAPIVIPDTQAIADFVEETAIPSMRARTIISMPLFSDGELFGCLNVASIGEVRLPQEDEIKLLQGLADQARLTILNFQLIQMLTDSQRNLRTLSESLVQIQETERANLARELHDEIGQLLTSVEMNLDYLVRSAQSQNPPENIVESLTNIRSQVQQLLRRVREMSLDLRPPMLEQLGLVRALLDHFDRFTRLTNIRIEFRRRGVLNRYDAQIEINVFRIIQEALTNIARHAQVAEAGVMLWSTPTRLGVKIEDHGRGFCLSEVEQNRRTSGVIGMYERAASCGGHLEIETAPGRGVSLTLEIPLDIAPALDMGKLPVDLSFDF